MNTNDPSVRFSAYVAGLPIYDGQMPETAIIPIVIGGQPYKLSITKLGGEGGGEGEGGSQDLQSVTTKGAVTTDEVTVKNIIVTGEDVTIPGPTTATAALVASDNTRSYSGANQLVWRIHAFKNVAGGRVYSEAFVEATLNHGEGEDYFNVQLDWDAVDGADGYRVLYKNLTYGDYFYAFTDTATNSLLDNNDVADYNDSTAVPTKLPSTISQFNSSVEATGGVSAGTNVTAGKNIEAAESLKSKKAVVTESINTNSIKLGLPGNSAFMDLSGYGLNLYFVDADGNPVTYYDAISLQPGNGVVINKGSDQVLALKSDSISLSGFGSASSIFPTGVVFSTPDQGAGSTEGAAADDNFRVRRAFSDGTSRESVLKPEYLKLAAIPQSVIDALNFQEAGYIVHNADKKTLQMRMARQDAPNVFVWNDIGGGEIVTGSGGVNKYQKRNIDGQDYFIRLYETAE